MTSGQSSLVPAPSHLFPDTAQRRRELDADIRALIGGEDRHHGALALCTRPGVLRRVATTLAESLRPGSDRLVTGARPEDVAVVTALALHTGLPVTVIATATGEDNETVIVANGHTIDRGDSAVVVVATLSDADPYLAALVDAVRTAGARLAALLAVADRRDTGNAQVDVVEPVPGAVTHTLVAAP